jgi:hypothetical protein
LVSCSIDSTDDARLIDKIVSNVIVCSLRGAGKIKLTVGLDKRYFEEFKKRKLTV